MTMDLLDSINHERQPQDDTNPEQKVVLCGDYGVGKTALFRRFVNDEFLGGKRNIMMDYFIRNYDIGDGRVVKLKVWDTAGIERHTNMAPNYFRRADAIVACCAGDRPETFFAAGRHLVMARSSWSATSGFDRTQPLFFLCASRLDVVVDGDHGKGESAVRRRLTDVARQSTANGMKVIGIYVVSSATGRGVSEMFAEIAAHLACRVRLRKVNGTPDADEQQPQPPPVVRLCQQPIEAVTLMDGDALGAKQRACCFSS